MFRNFEPESVNRAKKYIAETQKRIDANKKETVETQKRIDANKKKIADTENEIKKIEIRTKALIKFKEESGLRGPELRKAFDEFYNKPKPIMKVGNIMKGRADIKMTNNKYSVDTQLNIKKGLNDKTKKALMRSIREETSRALKGSGVKRNHSYSDNSSSDEGSTSGEDSDDEELYNRNPFNPARQITYKGDLVHIDIGSHNETPKKRPVKKGKGCKHSVHPERPIPPLQHLFDIVPNLANLPIYRNPHSLTDYDAMINHLDLMASYINNNDREDKRHLLPELTEIINDLRSRRRRRESETEGPESSDEECEEIRPARRGTGINKPKKGSQEMKDKMARIRAMKKNI